MMVKLKTLLAGLSVTAMVAIAAGLLFAGGELRQNFRAACGQRDAGWLTRHACDWFDVVPPAPEVAIALPDSDAAQSAERHVAPPGTIAQGITILDLKKKDLAELERLLARDVDGDGQVGHITPRLAEGFSMGDPLAPPRGDLILADKDTPELCRGARVVTSVPAAGGTAVTELIPNPVPNREWLHELDWELAGTLPVAGKKLADEIKLSGRYTFAREHALHFGIRGWTERLPEAERLALAKEFDWGVDGVLSVRCRGLFDCKPR